jgi:hypothetical protein
VSSTRKLNVVVVCEESGIVREAFRRRGHDAISVDLQPSAQPGPHHQGDALEFLFKHADEFDLMIAHPFCTYTAVSGNRHYADTHYRKYGVAFADAIWHQPIPMRCLEHPVSVLPTKSDIDVAPQYIQPWQFGHGETKRTALFLAGLPKLIPTKIVDGREPRVWTMPPGPDRKKLRSRTYQGIADAMAQQWGQSSLSP